MKGLNLTDHNLWIQAHHGSVQDSLEASDFDREELEDWGSEPSEGLDWEALAEERNLEYAEALQEAEGIARYGNALEACALAKTLLNPRHPSASPLFQACVDELVIRQSKPGCCQAPYHRVECWAQWDQQSLAFIRTWIWEQLQEQGFVNGDDATHFGQVVYQTVFSDCWKDIYQFFLRNRESITEAAKHRARKAFSLKLSTSPENTDSNLSFLTNTIFKHVMHDCLLRLKLEPQKIGTYFLQGTSKRFSASGILWALHESLLASYDFFIAEGIEPYDCHKLIDDLMAFIEPGTSFYEYLYRDGETLEELDLGLALRTLAKILSQASYKHLFADLKHH